MATPKATVLDTAKPIGKDEVIAAVRHAVVERLFWDPRVGGGKVDVTVASGGEVTLKGLVETWPEALAAGDDAVREGAAHVDNLVRVARNAP